MEEDQILKHSSYPSLIYFLDFSSYQQNQYISEAIKLYIYLFMFQFQSLEYPRRKNFIKNLNILLTYEPVSLPDKNITHNLFAKSQTSVGSRKGCFDLSNKKQIKRPNTQGFPSSRNISKVTQKVLNTRPLTSSRQLKRQKMKPALSMQNLRKSFRKASSMNKFHTINRINQNSSDLRVEMNSAQLFKGGSENSSRQNYNTSERRLSNNEVIYDYRPKEEKKKEFLKKGTNLNKQILTNLMRKKLSRDVVDPQNYIENDEILKMVKIYKGTDLAANYEGINEDRQEIRKEVEYLEGWQNYTSEMQQ